MEELQLRAVINEMSNAIPNKVATIRSTSSYQLHERLVKWTGQLSSLRRVKEIESRQHYEEELTKLFSVEQGFVSAIRLSKSWLIGIRGLKWDSEFFDAPMAKLEPIISPNLDTLNEECINEGKDLVAQILAGAQAKGIRQVVAPVDAADSLAHAALQLNGFMIMDSICCYVLALSSVVSLSVDSSVRKCDDTEQFRAALYNIAAVCFGNRAYNCNRFNSDPWFAPEKIRNMYGLWATKSLTGELADQVFAYMVNEVPVGFITIKLPSENDLEHGLNLAKIPLNAVHPHYQGRGIYRSLVHHSILWLKEQGIDWVEIRTQLPNSAVHKTWQAIGANLAFSYHTFHKSIDLSRS